MRSSRMPCILRTRKLYIPADNSIIWSIWDLFWHFCLNALQCVPCSDQHLKIELSNPLSNMYATRHEYWLFYCLNMEEDCLQINIFQQLEAFQRTLTERVWLSSNVVVTAIMGILLDKRVGLAEKSSNKVVNFFMNSSRFENYFSFQMVP